MMIAKALINNSILSMSPENSALEILGWMEEYKVSHLPVVDGNRFVGLLAESNIFNIDNPENPIGKKNKFLKKTYVKSDQHMFEIIKIMAEEKLSLLPVLDKSNKYIGVITPQYIIENFSNYAAVIQPGSIIVLSVSNRDYFASQIVQIIESNDAKLLSLFVSSESDSASLDVTIKVNKLDISGILQTFQRYSYEVKASWFDEDQDYLQDRFDSLMNYLSI
jgi:acetoin utilization protein AcuB